LHPVWNSLPKPWQVTFAAAAKSYLEGESAPVGAAVFSESGEVVAVGRNGTREHRLAHAEMDALGQVPYRTPGRTCTLYVTVEPCPMCTGAIRMAQIGKLGFASRDPAAGYTNNLRTGSFMAAVPCQIMEPDNSALEHVTAALVVEHRARTGHERWRAEWAAYQPQAFAVGTHLATSRTYDRWRSKGLSADQLFAAVLAVTGAA
jgi:tRNA(Arg) A34 adenosine deaminase TadA